MGDVAKKARESMYRAEPNLRDIWAKGYTNATLARMAS
jgi:hypothetical protein